MEAQLDELTTTYNQMCKSSTQQLQQLEQQLAKEEERKVYLLKGWAEMERGVLQNYHKNVFIRLLKALKKKKNNNHEGTFYKMWL